MVRNEKHKAKSHPTFITMWSSVPREARTLVGAHTFPVNAGLSTNSCGRRQTKDTSKSAKNNYLLFLIYENKSTVNKSSAQGNFERSFISAV